MYVVICRSPTDPSCAPGAYVAATRTLFPSEGAALKYAEGVANGREPRIVSPDEYLRECLGWKVLGAAK